MSGQWVSQTSPLQELRQFTNLRDNLRDTHNLQDTHKIRSQESRNRGHAIPTTAKFVGVP